MVKNAVTLLLVLVFLMGNTFSAQAAPPPPADQVGPVEVSCPGTV